VDTEEINKNYNSDIFSPIDGHLIEICDKLAAYIEAYLSIKHGITSHYLEDGHRQIYKAFGNSGTSGLNTGMLFDYFKL
jgi:putative hydrolase of HD superfamily